MWLTMFAGWSPASANKLSGEGAGQILCVFFCAGKHIALGYFILLRDSI